MRITPEPHRPFGVPALLLAGMLAAVPVVGQDNTFPSTGNAGIGTTTPQAPLEIQSSSVEALMWDNGKGLLQNSSDAVVWERCEFNVLLDSDNNQTCSTFQLFRDVVDSTNVTPGVLLSLNGGDSWLDVGDLGIGTTSPAARFHVFDTVASENMDLLFDANAPVHGVAIDTSLSVNWSKMFKFMTGGSGTLFGLGALVSNGTNLVYGYIGGNSTENTVWQAPWMTFLPSGRVGIGTTSPAQQLSVAGTVESTSGGFKFPDGTVQATAASGSGNSLDASDGSPTNAVFVDAVGHVGIGTTTPASELDVQGTTTTEVLEITGGSDLSERFEVGAGDDVLPGTVVSIDPDRPGKLRVADRAYDRTVAGVVSGAAGIRSGMVMGQQGTVAFGEHPVALTGRVYVRADTSNGAIAPGDLLTTSTVAGHAMRADPEKASGAILGKAMTPLTDDRGLVLVLVSLQ